MRKLSYSRSTIVFVVFVSIYFGFVRYADINHAGIAYAAPSITNIAGLIQDGQVISVSGTGFGANGPTVVLFDDFEGGAVGQNIKTGPGSAKVGQWDLVGQVPPKYSTRSALSGTKAFEAQPSAGIEAGNNMQTFLPVDSHDFFLSWWCFVPSDSPFPGEGNLTLDGNWKILWVSQDALWNNSNDTFFATVISSPPVRPWAVPTYFEWKISGNTVAWTQDLSGANKPVMTKGQWKRFWWWEHDDGTTGAAGAWELTASGVKTLASMTGSRTLKPGGFWQRVSVNGYVRNPPDNSIQMFDDVYVAAGPNAQARIEIGTGCTGGVYTACTNLSVSTVNSWSDGTVTATARLGGLSGTAHIFLFDGNGLYNSSGYPVKIGGRYPPPAPVQNFRKVP